jgi:ABC-2 type transport system ATP-binding protein
VSDAIEVRALSKTYDGFFGRSPQPALRDVDLSIPSGAAFGLIGLNGAGKTTLVKALLDVVRPTSGSIRVLGGSPAQPGIRARVGYLPERLYLPPRWKPTEVLASVARLRGIERADAEIRRQLGRVGLGPTTERPVGDFSKGMKQRLGLAVALLGAPELLILDEPSDGIDPVGRVEIRAILKEEIARGATILLNSHLLSETERICERIGVLADGKLLTQGSLKDLCGSPTTYRLRFSRPLSDEAVAALGVTPGDEPGGYRCEAKDSAAVNAVIDEARRRGAEFTELRPDLRSLEDLLHDLLRKPS